MIEACSLGMIGCIGYGSEGKGEGEDERGVGHLEVEVRRGEDGREKKMDKVKEEERAEVRGGRRR